ncbi:MAG: hypothetical protein CME06_16415 [Gemmatimonadetes bacterium]|nr:hypothetical protein [Gemmatimonadota bacterium]
MSRGPSSRSTIVISAVSQGSVLRPRVAFAVLFLALCLRASGIGFDIALDQGGVGAWIGGWKGADLLWPALHSEGEGGTPLHHLILTAINSLCFGIAKLIGVANELDFRAFLDTAPALRILVARSVSVVTATGTVWALIRFGPDLAGGFTPALLAAGFLAIAPLHVRLAHYGTPDALFTLLATGALLAIVRVAEGGSRRTHIWAGLLTGSALAESNLAIPLIPIYLWASAHGRRRPLPALLGLASGATAFAAIELISSVAAPLESPPMATQLAPPQELGWGFLILAGVGLASLARTKPRTALLGALWLAGTLIMTTSFGAAPQLALVSVAPLLLLLAARGCTAPFQRFRPRRALAATALAALVPAAELMPALAKLHRIYHTPDSRTVAAQWIADILPPGFTVTVEAETQPKQESASTAAFDILISEEARAPSRPAADPTLIAHFPSIPGSPQNHHPEIRVHHISDPPPRRGSDPDGYYPFDGGASYIMQIPADVPSNGPERHGVSTLALLENGVPLGPAHQGHDAIRRQGKGRYSHWKGRVFFSSSDGSNPNTNGYDYTWIEMK